MAEIEKIDHWCHDWHEPSEVGECDKNGTGVVFRKCLLCDIVQARPFYSNDDKDWRFVELVFNQQLEPVTLETIKDGDIIKIDTIKSDDSYFKVKEIVFSHGQKDIDFETSYTVESNGVKSTGIMFSTHVDIPKGQAVVYYLDGKTTVIDLAEEWNGS